MLKTQLSIAFAGIVSVYHNDEFVLHAHYF